MVYIIILVTIAVTLIYMRIETTFLAKSRINFSTSSKGLRIVHLSDIHINKIFIPVSRLLTFIGQADPDIIIISGDYIEAPRDIPKFISFLKPLTGNCKVYLTLGNHDHKALHFNTERIADFVKQLKAAGGEVLINSSVKIHKDRYTYNLIGIDDLRSGKPDIARAFKDIKSSFETGCINIAVSHNPDIVFQLPHNKTDYLLCGHFHGGQIWMPFNLEFKIMRSEKLCKMKCFRGLHKINGINMYINRGLGNVIFPFRFFSIPEVAVIQLPASPGNTDESTGGIMYGN
ncbi:putative metallophosphoesterase [Ruminiclostridium hungatei]|uniref:Putative metallophosphoesterase n=1 Tax=Ruminiclostridium hungatei TaxID=48256 RepID=A0A1V4SEG8_RUMHU|nr:metallophosphoesterase [Ruminiclostridium hungatei]OPX42250.1 putative metallophosphoesterase [Ruminiclostridium hungatei]